MRRILGLATALAIALSGVGVPAASADECLAITGTTVTGIGTCSNDIVIPDGITIIANSAFANSAITSVTIPASVTTIGEDAFFGNVSLESVTFEAGSQLTSIGSYAFYYAVSLTSITIPEFVTSIASTSFSSAMILTSFDVNADNATYKAIDGVLFTNDESTLLSYPLGKTASSYMVPASVTTIAPTAFFNATSLQTVTFEAGSSLVTIGNSAFGNASSLMSVTIPASVTSIGSYAFGNASSLTSVTFSTGSLLTSIGNGAFENATSLTSITIPANVTTIEGRAFYNTASLQSVTFEAGSTLDSIGDSAFLNTTSLLSLTIPVSVTTIGSYAFYGASSLTSIAIPEGISLIGFDAFSATSSLTSFTVSGSNTNYKSVSGVLFTKDGAIILAYPNGKIGSSYTIPDGVIIIMENAFFGATSLTSITIPEGVTSIRDNAFRDTSLTSITIPASVNDLRSLTFDWMPTLASINVNAGNEIYKSDDGVLFYKDGTTILTYPRGKTGSSYTIPGSVTSIGEYAFYFAPSLTTITIPETVTAIGRIAFYGATSLESVIFLGSPPTVGDMAFLEMAPCVIASVNPDLQSQFTLVEGKWNSLIVNEECPVVVTPEEPTTPSTDDVIAAAREAARVAAEKREAQKRQARSDLTTVSAASLTLEKFTTAEIVGVTAANLAQVSAEITALPTERRNQITEILKIARKFEVVDMVASGQRIDAAMLQEIGLIPLDSKHKSALTVALSKLPKTERSSYAQIQVAIAAQVKKIQARKDRLTAVRTLISAR